MKRIPKHIKFPADLVAQIEQYQKDNYISRFIDLSYSKYFKSSSPIALTTLTVTAFPACLYL